MIIYRYIRKGQLLEGAGNVVIKTPGGPILVDAREKMVRFPGVVNVVVEVPTDDPQKPKTVVEVFTRTVRLLPGPVVIHCPLLPKDGLFGASRDWSSHYTIHSDCVIAAEWDNMELTGNAQVVSKEKGDELLAENTHLLYDTWDAFEKDYNLQVAEIAEACPL